MVIAILLTVGIATAQRTHTGHYLYKGQRVEVPVCEESALVYFRTSVMPADEVRQHYRCLREVRLDKRNENSQRSGAITSLSPNPTTGMATLEYLLPDGTDVATIVVTSPMGMEVYRQEASGDRHDIDLRGMQPGVYTVYLTGKESLLGMKTIVLK